MNVACPARRIVGMAVLAAAGLLAGCGVTAAPPSAPSAPASQGSSPATNSSSPASGQPTTPAATPQALAAGPGECTPGDLHLGLGQGGGTAGSIYYPLQLTNISSATCTLYGYPGVAFVTAPGGSVIGGPAVRNPTFPKQLVTLAPGAIAHAFLQVGIAGNYPAAVCKPVTAHWLQVFPPNQYSALDVAFTAQVCTGPIQSGSILGIDVVQPGASGT